MDELGLPVWLDRRPDDDAAKRQRMAAFAQKQLLTGMVSRTASGPRAATVHKHRSAITTRHDALRSDNSQLTAECLETSACPPQCPYEVPRIRRQGPLRN